MSASVGQTVILADGRIGLIHDVAEDGSYSGVVVTGPPFTVDAPPKPEPAPTPPPEPQPVADQGVLSPFAAPAANYPPAHAAESNPATGGSL